MPNLLQASAAPSGTRGYSEGLPRPEECIHRLFEAQARRTPDAVAVVFDGKQLTYDELNRRSNRLARYLRSLGVGPDALVGVCSRRSFEMVVSLLGTLKAGGAYLPLDPDYPADRLAFMVQDAEVRVLLTQKALQPHLPKSDAQVFYLDSDWSEIAADDDEDLSGGAAPDGLAYVIYTSGSTGRPKGVEIAHRGVCNNLAWRQSTFPLSAKDRLLQTYSFSFDPSVWAFFWPLVSGARLVLSEPGRHGDPSYLIDAVIEEQISVVGFSPSLLSVLLDHPKIALCRSLRHVFCGGEALNADLQRRFFSRLSADLHNVYGPTEATIDTTWWTCRPEDEVVPIGHPVPGLTVSIRDESGSLVPDGGSGELHVAGVGLARGYLRRPQLTAERFIPNPAPTPEFPILYRTGDLARRRPDGAIEYLGRLDNQVKVRGFRIELGEIEAVLTRHPDVRDAAVMAWDNHSGERRLVAYVVPAQRAAPRRELKEHVTATLPAYMAPSAIVFLDSLPLSPNGKVERRHLPPPSAADWERDGDLTPPETPLQHQLIDIFESLLDVRPLGIRDDFFEWGGHSLLAARLVDRISQECSRTVALTILKSGATVERLAALLEQETMPEPDLPLLQRWSAVRGHPFFFLHGDFTGGFYCRTIARHLDPEHSLYALMPHGADGRPVPASIEEMAREYLTTIRAVQPDGPYRIGGFCNGGLVAYEVARRLAEQGQAVELLALIEPVIPATLAKLRLHETACRVSRRFGMSARHQHRVSLIVQASITPLLRVLKKARGIGEQWGRALTRDPGPNWAEIIPEAYRNTAAHYHLRPYSGRVTLFLAYDDLEKTGAHQRAGWHDLASEVLLDTIPGGHYTSLTEHLPGLADRLRLHLEAVIHGTPPPSDFS